MNALHLMVDSYDRPLVRPLTIGQHVLHTRRGLIVTLTDESGRMGHGEIAPLPGLHRESLEQARAQVDVISRSHVPLAKQQGRETWYPSVRLGLGMARMQLQWGRYLGPGMRIKLNALVLAHDGAFIDQALALADQGYHSIKVKVGRQDLNRDIELVVTLRDRLNSKTRLRLDANRAWTLDQAIQFATEVGKRGIQYIEEPLIDMQELKTFCTHTRFPVALDETLMEVTPETLPRTKGIVALVIKPAVIGSLVTVSEYIGTAGYRGWDSVLSSVFESEVALHFYGRLACEHGLENTPQGLDTWRWFKDPTCQTKKGCLVVT